MTCAPPPKIAVLMAAYQGMVWLQEQVDSILQQKDVDVHLFVSVDSSDDGTEYWITQRAAQSGNITVLPCGFHFGSAGKNFYRLLRDTQLENYDAIALADQDDIWFNDKLSRAWSFLEQGYDAYSSNVIAFWPDGRKQCLNKAQPQTQYDYFFEAAGPGCTYLLRSSVACKLQHLLLSQQERVDLVDLHDWLIYAFCRNQKYKWYIDSQPGMHYRQHSSNQVGANVSIKAYIKRIKLVKNGWYRDQVVRISELLDPAQVNNFNSRCFLIMNFSELRRRPRDKLYLLLLIILGLY
ncbi:glycosyltransferase [Oceanospirillum sp.]|uniref:glycosyltransferase n=1 Tax=Oceanospirillum sp. TaxID=2021254 RepID=UPI003A900EA9